MALAPDTAPWHRRFRMLLGIYLLAMVFGVREYVVAHREPPVDPTTPEWSEMARVISQVNPGHPDTEFLEAMEALQAGEPADFVRLMEDALAQGVKHNDILMQFYAQQLLSTGADYRQVNLALNNWRENHPGSAETLWIPLTVGPRDQGEAGVLRRALAEVSWVHASEVQAPSEDNPQWRVVITFRPAREVDIRQAIAAVSMLSLTADERQRFRVVCLTLQDCQVSPR